METISILNDIISFPLIQISDVEVNIVFYIKSNKDQSNCIYLPINF